MKKSKRYYNIFPTELVTTYQNMRATAKAMLTGKYIVLTFLYHQIDLKSIIYAPPPLRR